VDTFTPCPFSRNVKTPIPVRSLGLDPLEFIHGYVSTWFSARHFARAQDRPARAGYRLHVHRVDDFAFINIGLLFPDRIQLKEYRVTALIPLPAMRPEPEPIKVKPVIKAKLLPPAPVFEQPRLIVPREVHRTPTESAEAPKVVLNQFAAPQLKMASAGGARPQLLHTGEFSGSSVTPTVNAAVQKVQTGGFGDPNGLQGTGKPNAKLYAAQTGAFEMPAGAGQGNGSGGAKGIKGTVASADFGNGIANGGKGDGRSSGAATEFRLAALDRSKWYTTHRKLPRPIRDLPPIRWKLHSSRSRFTPTKLAI